MKKVFLLILSFMLVLSMTACSKEEKPVKDVILDGFPINSNTEKKEENAIPSQYGDATYDNIYVPEKEMEENVYWVGAFPFNKEKITDIKNVYIDEYGYSYSFFFNEDFYLYEEKDINISLKLRAYKNFYPYMTSEVFGKNMPYNTYYKINTTDNKSSIEYVVCVEKPDKTIDVLSINIVRDGAFSDLKDFPQLNEICKEIMLLGVIGSSDTELPDFRETNQEKQVFLSDEEIFTLISKHVRLSTEFFGNDETLPLNYEQTTKDEFKNGLIRVDIESTNYYTLDKISAYVSEVWDSNVTQYLMYYPNGVTYSYSVNEEGGVAAKSQTVRKNPYYLEKNGVLYSSAVNEFDETYESLKKYSIEYVSVTETQAHIRLWYNNPLYREGIEDIEKFLYYDVLLTNENDNWKLSFIENDISLYGDKDVFAYYDTVKETPDKCHKPL